MPEKKLRSILLGILLWVLLFTASTVAAYKLDKNNIDIAMLIIIPIICVILSYIYMRAPREKSVYEGTRLGFTWFVIMLTLDVIVLVYILENGWEYFRTWTIWISYAEVVFLCGVIGALMKPTKEEIEQRGNDKIDETSKNSKTEGDTYFSK